MIKENDLIVYEISGMPSGASDIDMPTVIIRNKRGYDTIVSPKLLERMWLNTEKMKDRVTLYKEAIKYEQFVPFEMI